MKIIKPGRPQEGYAIEQTCTGRGNGGGGCSAVLLVEAADLYVTQSHCSDETDSFVTFKCAACGVLTDVDKPSSAAWAAAQKNGLHPAVYAVARKEPQIVAVLDGVKA